MELVNCLRSIFSFHDLPSHGTWISSISWFMYFVLSSFFSNYIVFLDQSGDSFWTWLVKQLIYQFIRYICSIGFNPEADRLHRKCTENIRGLRIKSWQLFCKIDRPRENMEIYIWKWMMLGALRCTNKADLKKKSKLQHCARCVYYLSEITTRTSNLKNTILVLIRPSK